MPPESSGMLDDETKKLVNKILFEDIQLLGECYEFVLDAHNVFNQTMNHYKKSKRADSLLMAYPWEKRALKAGRLLVRINEQVKKLRTLITA